MHSLMDGSLPPEVSAEPVVPTVQLTRFESVASESPGNELDLSPIEPVTFGQNLMDWTPEWSERAQHAEGQNMAGTPVLFQTNVQNNVLVDNSVNSSVVEFANLSVDTLQ